MIRKSTCFRWILVVKTALLSLNAMAEPFYVDTYYVSKENAGNSHGTVVQAYGSMLVGAPNNTNSTMESWISDGKGNYRYRETLTIPEQPDSHFGQSMALVMQGGEFYLFVGAPRYDVSGETDVGTVRVFRSDEYHYWDLIGTIHSPTTEAHAKFGYSLDAAPGKLIIGAPGLDYVGEVNSGAAFVYDISDIETSWVALDQTIATSEVYAQTGYSVAIGFAPTSNHFLYVVGSPTSDTSGPNSGRVDVCREGPLLPWNCRQHKPSSVSTGDRFGQAVSADENYFVAGAPKHDLLDKANAGAVYVAKWDNGKSTIDHIYNPWVAYHYDIGLAEAYAEFGSSVSIYSYASDGGYDNGDFDIIAGAPKMNRLNYVDMGAAFTFKRRGRWQNNSVVYEDEHRVLDVPGGAYAHYKNQGKSVTTHYGHMLTGVPDPSRAEGEYMEIWQYGWSD